MVAVQGISIHGLIQNYSKEYGKKWCLALSWRRSFPYWNQSIDFHCKSIDWFLYNRNLRHEIVNSGITFASFSKQLCTAILPSHSRTKSFENNFFMPNASAIPESQLYFATHVTNKVVCLMHWWNSYINSSYQEDSWLF